MRHDWIFEVLADVATFARRNGMILFAAKLDEAVVVARAEIAGAPAALGPPPADGVAADPAADAAQPPPRRRH